MPSKIYHLDDPIQSDQEGWEHHTLRSFLDSMIHCPDEPDYVLGESVFSKSTLSTLGNLVKQRSMEQLRMPFGHLPAGTQTAAFDGEIFTLIENLSFEPVGPGLRDRRYTVSCLRTKSTTNKPY